MSFAAYFDGICAKCEGRIQGGRRDRAGDLIERASTSSRVGTYSHVVCPEPEPTALDLRPREKICLDCHLVHPGEC